MRPSANALVLLEMQKTLSRGHNGDKDDDVQEALAEAIAMLVSS